MREILLQYGIRKELSNIKPLGNGLINSTWLVENGNERFVLQQINSNVFKTPADIAFNIRLIADHVGEHFPEYRFTSPVKTGDHQDMVEAGGHFYRMFSFVDRSHTTDTVQTTQQAYEAAKQFGKFTRLLAGLDAGRLKITLPAFHDLSYRYEQFEAAQQNGNHLRLEEAKNLIALVREHKNIVDAYAESRSQMQIRCIHHDTKISNVLFDENDNGLCVIDLDTVMPGYFISDLGDMMRTYLCPVSEEETDLSKIMVRREFYDAVITGYLSEMGEELTAEEMKLVHFSGEFMIYMQALRFLTDHLNNDVYYRAKYEGHNFNRAANQFTLLKKYRELAGNS
jgi:Ser/Thr protein kinase RdoA (MazF antagonist)